MIIQNASTPTPTIINNGAIINYASLTTAQQAVLNSFITMANTVAPPEPLALQKITFANGTLVILANDGNLYTYVIANLTGANATAANAFLSFVQTNLGTPLVTAVDNIDGSGNIILNGTTYSIATLNAMGNNANAIDAVKTLCTNLINNINS